MLSAPQKGQTPLVRCSTVRWKRKALKSVTRWTLCSAKIEALLQTCVQTLPRAPLTAAQAGGLTGTPRETWAALQIPSQLLWVGTGFTKFCNILSVSVTAKTEVQSKCCPEHLSGWVFCIWTFRFGPSQVSLGLPFSGGPTQDTLDEQKRL